MKRDGGDNNTPPPAALAVSAATATVTAEASEAEAEAVAGTNNKHYPLIPNNKFPQFFFLPSITGACLLM